MLMHNIIRFIGDDFRLEGKINAIPYVPNMEENTQHIKGEFKGATAVVGYSEFMKEFAVRYSGEDDLEEEYISIAVQDFLNQHNGLFSMELSKTHDIEIELTATDGRKIDVDTTLYYLYILPVEFTFGVIYFCFSL